MTSIDLPRANPNQQLFSSPNLSAEALALYRKTNSYKPSGRTKVKKTDAEIKEGFARVKDDYKKRVEEKTANKLEARYAPGKIEQLRGARHKVFDKLKGWMK